MADPSYSYRHHVLSPERIYRLSPDGLAWNDNRHEGRIAYGDVEQVHIFRKRILWSPTAYWSCDLFPRSGGKIKLGAANRVGLRAIEDRTASYIPFIQELEARITAANPKLRVVTDRHWKDRIAAVTGHLMIWLCRGARHLNLDRSADLTAWILRKIGPHLRGHRTARSQIAIAYPEKSPAEIEQILSGMWDNLGRVGAEYVHLDRIWDYDPATGDYGRVSIDPASTETLRRLTGERGPLLMFGAHLANWEITQLAAPLAGRAVAMIFKPPKSEAISRELDRLRKNSGAELIAADAETTFRIRDALKRGWIVGMLLDQHYAHGVEVRLFNQPFKINPLFGRFVRMFDCPIYGARTIRLPNKRFRLELSGPFERPRDTKGRVDVAGTMQIIASVIEGWVREHPEQWLWLHRHWR